MTPAVRRITAAREPLWNLTPAGPDAFVAVQLDYPSLVALLVACQGAIGQHRRATKETEEGRSQSCRPSQINGDWRADHEDDEVPLCHIRFSNEMALLPDEKKRELVMALVRRYCRETCRCATPSGRWTQRPRKSHEHR